MKIAVFGQPTHNIGDFAACKALVSMLKNEHKLDFYFNSHEKKDLRFDAFLGSSAKYIAFNFNRKLRNILVLLALLCPFLIRLLPAFFILAKRDILKYDAVIIAPGGLELGQYENWNILYFVVVSIALRKRVYLYSRSFGRFKNENRRQRIFCWCCVKALKKVSFLGIRESESAREAEKYKIPFTRIEDIVFTYNALNVELNKVGLPQNFVVIVPAWLRWNEQWTIYSLEQKLEAYEKLVRYILCHTNKNVVLMPHDYDDCDDEMNLMLKKKVDSERIFVPLNIVDSDQYLQIYRNANYAICFRFHQTIFSILAAIPFVAVCYEHKMMGLLEQSGLQEWGFSFKDFLDQNDGLILKKINCLDKYGDVKDIETIRRKFFEMSGRSKAEFLCLLKKV